MKLSEYLKQNGMTSKEYFDMQKRKSSGKTTLSDYRKNKEITLKNKVGFDTIDEDLKKLGATVDSVYTGWQPQDTINTTKSSITAMQERLNAYQEYAKTYGGEDISELVSGYQTVLADLDNLSATYGKFKTADDYKKAEDRKKSLPTADLKAVSAEVADLDKQIAEIKSQKEKFDSSYKADGGYVPSASNYNRPSANQVDSYKAWQAKSSELDKQLKELENKKADRQAYYDDAKSTQEALAIVQKETKMASNPDNMGAYDQYVANWDEARAKEKEATENTPWWVTAIGDAGLSSDNPINHNLNMVIRDKRADKTWQLPQGEWSDDEKRVLGGYFLEDPSGQAAEDYVVRKNNEKAIAEKNKTKQKITDSATSSFGAGVAHTAGAMVTKPLGLADYLDDVTDKLAGKPITEESFVTPFEYAQTVNGGISENLNEMSGTLNENIPILGGKGLGDAYGMGVSVLESGASAHALGAVGTAISYFGQGAAAGVDDALARGATDDQALLYGFVLGAAEAGSEYIGADKLLKLGSANEVRNILAKGFKNGGGKEFWKLVNKQGMAEELEELVSGVAGQVADDWILNGKSNFELKAQEYRAIGMSAKEAQQKAWRESIEDVAYNAVSGYLSGAVHAAPQLAVSTAVQKAENKKVGAEIRGNNRIGDVLNIASLSPKESDAYAAYTQYAKRSITADNITDAQVGNLYGMIEGDSIETLRSKKSTAEQTADAVTTLNRIAKAKTENTAKKLAQTVSENAENEETATLSERETVVRELAKSMSAEEAKLFSLVDDGKTNPVDYADSFNLVVAMAQNEYDADYILEHRGVLSTGQVKSIYQSVVTNPKMAQQKTINDLIAKQGDNLEIKGTVDDSVIDYNNTGAEGKVNWGDLHTNVKATVAYVSGFATKVAGMDVKLVTNGREYGFTGQYDRQGNVMYVDITALTERVMSADTKGRKDNSRFIVSTVAHEVTHWMEEKAPELYAQYGKMVMDALTSGGKTEAEVLGRRRALLEKAEAKRAAKENRKPREITDKEVRREVIARASEDMLAMSEEGKKFFESLTETEQKRFVDKIKEVIQNIKNWIKDVLSTLKSDAPEATELRALAKDLDAISKKWDEMLRASAKANAAMKKEGVTDKDIMQSKAGADTQMADIDTYTTKQYNDFGWVAVNNVLTGKELKKLYSQFAKVKLNKEQNFKNKLGEYLIPVGDRYGSIDKIVYIKGTNKHPIIRHIVEIKKTYREYAEKIVEEVMDYEATGLYYDAFEIYESYARAEVFTVHKAIDYPSYSELKRGTRGQDGKGTRGNDRERDNGARAIDDSTRKVRGENGEVSYSDIDSDGNELSAEQQEFFKDSKVRNSEGKLIPVYHGTVADFTVFDREFGNSEGDFGRGFYFTNTPEDVEINYANEEGPDLKNKIERWADWHEDEFDSHEDAVEAARKKYITSEPHTIEAYLNMKNPVELFNSEKGTYFDYEENYDEETDEYGEPEGLLVDFVEALQNNEGSFEVWKSPDYWSIFSDRIYDGGLYLVDAIQMLKEQIVEEVQDEEGNLAVNELIRMALEDMGYDGIIDHTVSHKFRNMKGMSPATIHYIVFNSNQAKRTDNLNPTNDPDIRYSDIDTEYMDAVNSGDMDKAQRMVDDAAKKAGYTVKAYHGTRAKFTTFDKTKIGKNYRGYSVGGFYFTTDKRSADYYSGAWKSGNFVENPQNTISAFLNLGNAKEVTIDSDYFYNGAEWLDIDPYQRVKAQLETHDSIVVHHRKGDTIVVKNSEQIKSADPVTYDDNGDVIPLSKRFDSTNDDIRHSDIDAEVDIYEVLGENKRLNKENKILRADFERLMERRKLEGKLTHGKQLNKNQLDIVAGHIRNLGNSTYSKEKLVEKLKVVYTHIATSDELAWDDLFARFYGIAEDVLDEARPVRSPNEYYANIYKELRNMEISLSDEQKQYVKSMLGVDASKAFFGKMKVTDKGMPLNSKWEELAGKYPNEFANDNDKDQVLELLEIYETAKELKEVVEEYDKVEQTRWLANEIYNQYWNVSPIRTVADKYDQKIKRLKFEHRTAMKELRDSYNERLEKQKKIDREERSRIFKKLRQDHIKELQEIKIASKERLEKYKDEAARKTRIQSITAGCLSLNDMLVKNSKDKHINEAMKGPVINLLQAIDFSSKRALGMWGGDMKGVPTNKDISLQKALSQVKDMMADANVGKEDLVELYGHDLDPAIEEMVDSVDNIMRTVGDNEFILNKMTLEDLNTLDKVVKTIKHAVSKMNEFHTVQHAKGINNLAQEEIVYADKLGKEKIYKSKSLKAGAKKLLAWKNINPYYAFKRFGTAGKKIFEAFQDGYDKFAFNIKKIIDFTNATYTRKEVREWEEEIKTFKVKMPATEQEMSTPDYEPQYQEVKLTVAQVMDLYLLNKREAAKAHLLGGGIRIADIEGKKGEVISQAEGVLLEQKEIDEIVGSLTARQIEVADKLSQFMNTVSSAWGNEVSMARFGYRAFDEKNYVPMQVDKNNLAVDDETEKNNSLFRLLIMSFTKSLTEGANNRLVVSSIFDVFAQHTSDMAKYNALALPVLDAFRWYNYKEKGFKGDVAFETKSVKQAIENAFGKDGQSYITTFLKDLNGQENTTRDTVGKGFFTKAKIASVGANLRVALLQPTAYLRASANIAPKYLLKGIGLHKPKTSIELAEKYCGMALWKSLGYYDTNVQRGVADQIKHAENTTDKIVEASMKGAELGDKLTFGALWNAAELETKDKRQDLKDGSEEFYVEVGKRLREIIYTTQVVDSVMTRSEMMRSSDGWDKFLTTFASEPTLSYNMLADAYLQTQLDARELGSKKAAIKKNSKHMARVFVAYTATNLAAALVESVFDIIRDDDDEEEDEFVPLYLENFLSNQSITSKIPWLKEGVSILQGFTSSRLDTQGFQAFANTIKQVGKLAQGEGSWGKTIKSGVQSASYLSGLPFYNAYRDFMATIVDWLSPEELDEILKDFY